MEIVFIKLNLKVYKIIKIKPKQKHIANNKKKKKNKKSKIKKNKGRRS
jgi:uncharacterized membrane protein (UPF0127 family)